MKTIYRIWIALTLLTLVFSLGLGFYAKNAAAQSFVQDDTDNAIRQAVKLAVTQKGAGVLGFVVNQVEVKHIFYAKDNRTAVVWLVQRDPLTGDIIGREPGIAIARNPANLLASAGSWDISLETPNTMKNLLTTLPSELITTELQNFYSAAGADSPSAGTGAAAAVFTGYKLPFSSALRIKITGSVGHFLDYNSCAEISCRYAYDFWNPDGSNRMFPLLAAKGGTIVARRDGCSNGDSACANYLVLRDDSTTPVTHQLYYHIAYHSIPVNLTVGTFVQQGQYIANTDDTGYSSDHHLHFHVYATPTGTNYSWGNSVRIIFSDVGFNGGEPRTCAETVNYPSYGTECSLGPDGKKLTADDDYLQSGNSGTQVPSGSLDVPYPWTVLTDKTLSVSGSASDALGVSKVEVVANYDGTWRTIGTAAYGNGVFAQDLDMCAANIPNGPVSLAVRIYNLAGNWAGPQTGLRQIFNNANCGGTPQPQVPACAPSADEVALYTEPGYYGFCKTFTAGTYTSTQLGLVGDNATASIQVGGNVRAVLYDQPGDLAATPPLGRLESFAVSDANLADNRIGSARASALWVMGPNDIANPAVYEPVLTFPGGVIDSDHNSAQANPANPKSSDSLVLTWRGARGATLFTSTLVKGGVTVKSMSAQNTQTWSVGSLPAGTYTWTVTACSGISSCINSYTNSTALTFTVDSDSLSSAGQLDSSSAAFDMESGAGSWTASGLWRWGDVNRLQPDLSTKTTKAWVYNNGSSFNSPTVRAGDLTSPPIRISASGTYYLHFRFFSGVEGSSYTGQTFAGPHWDQRRVQVSVDGGAFSDVNSLVSAAPLADDAQNTAAFWPNSPDIPLGSLSTGQIVRVRFHFDTVDETLNDFYGWAIDDVSLDTSSGVTGCSNDRSNESVASATPLTFNGAAYDSRICPRGDTDYYSFSASGGQPVRIKVDAKTSNSANPLDTLIQLIDTNGKDVLASNDDQDPTNPAPQYRDSLIQATLPRTGMYYIRVKAWDYPGSGGVDYAYLLSVSADSLPGTHPTVQFTKPPAAKQIPNVPFILEASATDAPGSAVQRVDFYWHDSNWTTSKWTKVGSDTSASDGWWIIFNPSMDVTGGAFYAMATNNGGGTGGAVMADVAPDQGKPTSAMQTLPASVNSTAVQLQWTSPDSDIDFFEVQYRLAGATAWTDWSTKPAGNRRAAWFVGAPGSYEFRLRAVDLAGNRGDYTAGAQAAVTLSGSCGADSFEPADNSSTTAAVLVPGELRQMNLCQGDVDWVRFDAQQGQKLVILLPSLGGGAALRARVYDPSGSTVLVDQTSGAGGSLSLRWTAPSTGTFSIQISASDASIYGGDVKFGVAVGPGGIYYFPYTSN